jgi:hypothetical protein
MTQKWVDRLRDVVSQAAVYNSVVIFSVLLAAGWFLYALHSHSKDDAGRGGAVAIMISFVLLFLRRNLGERVYETILKSNPSLAEKISDLDNGVFVPFTSEESTWLFHGILGRINTEADEQKNQNFALFLSSVFGTFVWGFGDYFYKKMGGT